MDTHPFLNFIEWFLITVSLYEKKDLPVGVGWLSSAAKNIQNMLLSCVSTFIPF